jgi:hypothetical protein
MPRYTDRFGLSILGPGDTMSADGYKFSDQDRLLIDRLLRYATETHHHTGLTPTDVTPDVAPTLAVFTTGGAMPANARYYYKYTLVDPDGNETGPSPAAYVDLPPAVAVSAAAALSFTPGGGTIEPGSYGYVLSAYTVATSVETKGATPSFISIPASSLNNAVTLILPGPPAGANGFNVYRKSPTGMHYLYLTSIASPTSGDTWTDDGSLDGDCDRTLPSKNTTQSSGSVSITFPGSTAAVPDGYSWSIYRTADPNGWGRSFLTQLVPAGATPTTPVTYLDTGAGTTLGSPPTTAQIVGAPPKVNLTDAAEVQGVLPPGLVTVPHVINFVLPGPLETATGSFQWVCDFDLADIQHVRAYLGIGSSPAATDVIVDVLALRPSQGEVAYASIFNDPADRPRVAVGDTIGSVTVPDIRHFSVGDLLSVDIVQPGGGATPTDHDLTINILLFTQTGSTTTSYVFEEA